MDFAVSPAVALEHQLIISVRGIPRDCVDAGSQTEIEQFSARAVPRIHGQHELRAEGFDDGLRCPGITHGAMKKRQERVANTPV
jgi:hypothetical protein